MRVQLERCPLWDYPTSKVDFGSFFRAKGVDCSGEEVKLAMPLDWEAVKGSLPERGGYVGTELVLYFRHQIVRGPFRRLSVA